jgi:uncharacterized protein
MFGAIIALLFGGRSRSESLGLKPVDLLVIETDGTMEQGDALKTTAAGMAATGLHLRDHSLDDALRHPAIRSRQLGLEALAQECQRCRLVAVCGGGLYAHRFDGVGFDRPTVYCADMIKLIDHIRSRVEADVARLSNTVAVAEGAR